MSKTIEPRFISIAFLFSLCAHSLFASTTRAETSSLPKQLKSMQAKYAGVKTLTTQFEQKRTSVALGTTTETSGRIYIKRPSSFRWETHQPDPSIMISNGKKLWYYTPAPDKKTPGRVQIHSATDVQSNLAVDLLSGQSDLQKSFAIEEDSSKEPPIYRLKPKIPAGDIDHIELYVEKKTNLIYKLILFTTIGNRTELVLDNVAFGPKLPDSMFNFTPPPNTEEIR